MVTEKKNGRRINLGDGEPSYFDDVAELKAYIDLERERWGWLGAQNFIKERALRNQIKRLSDFYFQTLENLAGAWVSEQEDLFKEVAENIEVLLSAWSFPSSDSPIGRYIIELSETQNPVATQLWILCISPVVDNATTSPNAPLRKIYDVIFNGSHAQIAEAYKYTEPYRYLATSHLSNVRLLTNQQGVKSWLDSVNQLHSEIKDFKSKSQVANKNFQTWVKAKQEEIDKKIQDSESAAHSIFRKFSKRILSEEESRLKDAESIREKAKQELDAATDGYRNKIDLDESVAYWKTKETEHSVDKGTWLERLKWAIGATGAIPIVIISLQLWLIHRGVIQKSDLLVGTIHPSLATICVIMLSLGSYIIRFFSHQYQSQLHLYLEAVERRTMIKTYLALLSEGRLDGHEDRKVALDTLFRPAQTGIIREQAALLPTEQIIKVISANKGAS